MTTLPRFGIGARGAVSGEAPAALCGGAGGDAVGGGAVGGGRGEGGGIARAAGGGDGRGEGGRTGRGAGFESGFLPALIGGAAGAAKSISGREREASGLASLVKPTH
jgi:hypothetical protein